MAEANTVSLDPEAFMLVFIDIQNDYCDPSGALGRSGHDLSAIDGAVEQCEHAREIAHSVGIPVVHVRTEHSEWTDTEAWLSRGSAGAALSPDERPIARSGTWGAEPYGIVEREDELVLIKHRYSGFASTALELVARARQRSHLLLAGFTTDVCVRATAIDAQARGFIPHLLTDATATTVGSAHEDACKLFTAFHGPALSVKELANAVNIRM